MLRAGAPLAEIGQVLRHARPLTTAVYARRPRPQEQALAKTTPPNTAPGRCQPPDQILAFLENL